MRKQWRFLFAYGISFGPLSGFLAGPVRLGAISEILAMNEKKIKEAQTKFVIRFDDEGLSLDEVLRP